GEVDIRGIFGNVGIDDSVALVVLALADEPREDARGIIRIGNTALCRHAVEGRDIVFRDGAPVGIAVALARPTFYPGEQALNAGAVRRDRVAVAGRYALLHPLAVNVLDQHAHQILG